jgi:NADH-quinone oxidoreductase subunit J
MFETIVFYVFAAILLFAAARVITARNPVHAALFLVLAFFTAAAIWLLLRAEFLAIALVLVYVGAVMVLFLFVVMMLDINLAVAVVMLAETVFVLGGRYFGLATLPAPGDPGTAYNNTKEIGRVVYTDYIYPFELSAVLLLVAIIAAISLTLRRRTDTKAQNPAQQVAVKRQDRVRLVSMPAEKEE